MSMPTITASGDAIGLTWRLSRWGGQPVIGHDGGTIGQTAHLRIAPGAGVAACVLTNSANSEELYQALFGEIFGELAGISMPANPEPAEGLGDVDLGRHAGRYERASHRFDISAQDGRLHAVSTLTGELDEALGAEPEEVTLYPADGTGDHLVGRSHDGEPWTAFIFGKLDDGTPYLYVGGRVNPLVG
jgi:hypothetical protein